jgi:hypothetical protein
VLTGMTYDRRRVTVRPETDFAPPYLNGDETTYLPYLWYRVLTVAGTR